MNLKLPVTDADVDALVKAYLDDEAGRVDVPRIERALEDRLRDPVSEASLPLAPKRGWPVLGGRLAVAASLCLAVAGVLYFAFAPEEAGAYALVQAAHQAMSSGVDRCYRIEGKLPDAWVRGNPFLHVGQQTRVWTRGDQFRVSVDDGDHPIAWGLDKDRNFWLIDGAVGFQFNRGEAPQFLRQAKFLLALNVRPLVRQFLDNFDLEREPGRTENGHRVILVHATLKPGRDFVWFDAAYLEIEPRTNLIRRLDIERDRNFARPAELSFTLLEQAELGEDYYQIEACLPAGGTVYGPNRAAERDRRFKALLASARRGSVRIQPGARLPSASQ